MFHQTVIFKRQNNLILIKGAFIDCEALKIQMAQFDTLHL